VLTLRLSVPVARADELAEALERTGGVRRLVRSSTELELEEIVFSADVTAWGADRVVTAISELDIPDDDYVLARMEVIAPTPVAGAGRHPNEGFAWVELVGAARANARPLARYLVLMGVAGVIAALGVMSANTILIIGAMAVSPDLLPVCATCVGIVLRRGRLVLRAFATLVVGLALVAAVSALLALALDQTGVLSAGFEVGHGGIGKLASVDYTTALVALAAGVAGILAFETRAGAAVGVAISVTTIPASAYLGVAVGVGEVDRAGSAVVVLAINVTLLILSGTLALLVQRTVAGRAAVRRATASTTRAPSGRKL
jgi:uncharacterized hydrophobic protein (TIGR00271 family)